MTTIPPNDTDVPGSKSFRPQAVLGRLPSVLQPPAAWLMSNWPGRVALRSTAGLVRIEVFDRAMTVAAQFFTSVFPLLIMAAVWVGSGESSQIADAVGLPDVSREALDQALDDTGFGTFGIVGSLIVIVSATSLSRALSRAFDSVWRLPRTRRRLFDAWRWLAAVLALAATLVLARALVRILEPLTPTEVWATAVGFVLHIAIALFLPWVLLSGRVPTRSLLPGAVVFGLSMLVLRPASAAYLPRALETSADRYGTIGVAFTYIAWLYVLSFTFLAAAVIGQVIATDDGRFGGFVRAGTRVKAAPRT